MINMGRIRIFEEKLIKSIIVKRRGKRWRVKARGYIGKAKVLTSVQKKEAVAFYKDYGKINMVFHEFYTQKTGKFCVNWIPDDMHYCKIDHFFNNWDAANYLDNKCYYDCWYFSGINIPKTLVKCINGMWMMPSENGFDFVSAEAACEFISQQDCFVKQATMSSGGLGVRKITKGTSLDEVKKLLRSMGNDIIVQAPIEQSEEMRKLNPTSVNTVRLLSFLGKDGSVKIYSVIVRMGIGNAVVDNASSGGITCGVEADGRLKPVAFNAGGKRYDEHPTTGLKFNEVVIPNYDKMEALIKEWHKKFPHFRLLSWDIAVDKNDEPMLVEVNLRYGELDFHQLNNGPVFGDDTKKILDEVFGK